MPGSDESLKLAATIVDAWSPQLRQMQRSLRSLSAETNAFHKGGIVASKSHTLALQDLRRQVTEVGTHMRGVLTPALAGLGVAGLSAAGAIAAVKAAVTGFSDSAKQLDILSRQTGLTVNQLRALKELMPHLGGNFEAAAQEFGNFNEEMSRLSRFPRLEIIKLKQALAGMGIDPRSREEVDAFARTLQGLGRYDQLKKILEYGDKIKNIDLRKKFYSAFHIPKEFATFGSKEIEDYLKNIGKLQSAWSPEKAKAGATLADTLSDLATALGELRDNIGADLAPNIKKIADGLVEWAKVHHKDIAEGLRQIGEKVPDFVKGVGLIAEALDSLRKTDPVDLTKLVDFTGFDKTTETFLATWKARLAEFKALFGIDREGAAAAESERQRLLQKNFPDAAAREHEQLTSPLPGGRGIPPQITIEGIRRQLGMPPAGKGPSPIQSDRIMPPEGTGSPSRPLWRKLWDMTDKGGGSIMPASFSVVGGGANPLLSGGGGAGGSRGLELIIEHGTLAALRDFAAEQKGLAGGGGGGGAPGMAAIRAAYSPSGSPAGEPSADAGADTGTRPSRSPLGSLPSLGGLPEGIESLRKFHPPSIPPGMGGAIADRLKAAGVDLPPALEGKIRKGGQVTEGDLRALPPATLEKINKHITGLGQPPLYTDQKPPHFGLGDIRKSLEGTAAGGLPDTGSYAGAARRGYGGATELPSGPSAANSYIAGQRAGYAKELQDPQFRSQFASMLGAEGPTLGTAESAMNRAAASGRSLHEMVAGRTGRIFYSTYGKFMGGSASALRKYNPLIDKTLSGSDTIRGMTDQGMPTDPNGPLHRGRRGGPYLGPYVGQHGNIFNDWQGGRYAKWRENFEAHAQEAAEAKKAASGEASAGLHGDALRHHFGVGQRGQKHADLLGHARDAGLVGAPLNHKVTGSASLDINVNGPRGTEAKMRKMDGLFQEAKINRGWSMPRASERS